MQSPNHRGFSLIELLVVISIISILIALLLPALGKAKTQAKYIRWAGYSHALRTDPGLVAYWNFENQEGADTTLWNRAAGNAMGVFGEPIEPPAVHYAGHGQPMLPLDAIRAGSNTPITNALYRPSEAPTFALAKARQFDPEELDAQFGDGSNSFTFPAWTSGRWDAKGALDFDGVLNYVRVPHHFALNLGDKSMTVAAWFDVDDSAPAGSFQVVAAKYSISPTAGWLLFVQPHSLGPDQHRVFFIGVGPGGGISLPGVAEGDGWHHVVATRNSFDDSAAMYINGELALRQTTGVRANLDSDQAALEIGLPSLGMYFNGAVDELAIFNRHVEESQALEMYSVGAPN